VKLCRSKNTEKETLWEDDLMPSQQKI